MRRTRTWLCVAVLAAAAACGDEAREASPRGQAAPATPAASPSEAPATPPPVSRAPAPLPDPVPLPPLPGSGVALDYGRGVLLLDLEGNVVADLRGYEIDGNPGAPGVWLRRGRDFFRLRASDDRFVPVSRARAARSSYEEPPLRLRPPAGAWTKGIGVSGHWRYAHRSDEGALLAQWSDECEVPTAFWKEPGRRPEVITGGYDYRHAPESVALGWSPDGRAVVLLGEGLCGYAGTPPGVYEFAAPGEGTLLFETRRNEGADMWP